MMLEDDFTYVLRKAMAGNGLSVEDCAARIGCGADEVSSLLQGRWDPALAGRLTDCLGLGVSAMREHPSYAPRAILPGGLRRLDLPFEQDRVNAWLLETDGCTALFDAGWRAEDLHRALVAAGVSVPERVFLTHGHRDHTGGLAMFVPRGIPVHAAGGEGNVGAVPGDRVLCGGLCVSACDLSGHADPALGYLIEGFPEPVLVTGDALFAGSIGGCRTPESYRKALHLLKRALASLPDATLLLPGHGPATTLGQERRSNPFLAGG